jgi:tRNA A-37 threonylcarbamoyl transferase component Bud32
MSLVSSARRKDKTGSDPKKSSRVDLYRNLDMNSLDKDIKNLIKVPELDPKYLIRQYGKEFFKAVPEGYSVSALLGKGAFGTTYSICKDQFACMAVKIIKLKKGKSELVNEINMQNKFNAKGLAPAIIGKPIFYNHDGQQWGIVTMAQIDGVLDKLLEEDLTHASLDDILLGFLSLVARMKNLGLAHRDAHSGNISYNYRRDAFGHLTVELSIIDFGFSSTKGSQSELEIIQFLRTLSMREKGQKGTTEHNREYLWDRLLAFYQANFNSQIKSWVQVDEMFTKLRRQSREK